MYLLVCCLTSNVNNKSECGNRCIEFAITSKESETCLPKTTGNLFVPFLPGYAPPPLLPQERPGTHCLRMREIFRYSFRKKLRALVRMRKTVLTKNTELSLTDSGDDLTFRTLLGYYFSDVAVSFFQTYSPTEK